MFYWPSPEEGRAYLLTRDESWADRSGQDRPGWYIGTEEYERRRAEAGRLLAGHLASKYT